MICGICRAEFEQKKLGRPAMYCGVKCRDKARQGTPNRKLVQKAAAKRHYQKNKEKILEKNKKWFELHPEKQKGYLRSYIERNIGTIRKKARDYIKRNRETVLARKRKYREDNPEKAGRWAKDNPEKVRESCRHSNHRRRALKKNSGGTYTRAEWDALVAFYGNKCLRCGKTGVVLSVDHVVPLSSGGANDLSNLQPLCVSCNCRKHKKTIDYRQEPCQD